MATSLPRYEIMGAQFADLPRISTAVQEAGIQQAQVQMQQFDQLGRALDRMSAFFQEKAVTEAEKKGAKYAIDNPLTKEDIDNALLFGQEVKVQGAGAAFQNAYLKTSARVLGSELQLEGQQRIAALAGAIKAGQQIDSEAIKTELKDLVDGYASTLIALDPDESLRVRSALTVAGNQLYKEATERQVLIEREQYDARLTQAVKDSQPLIETIVKQAGALDPTTGKEIDIDALLEVQRRPLYDSIRVTGSSKHVDAFNKVVADAKVGALTSVASSPEFATTAGDALGKILKGDFGKLSGVYKNLTDTDKTLVRERVLKTYADVETVRKQEEAKAKNLNKEKANVLSIEFLNPKTTVARKREIVNSLVMLDEMTLGQAEDALKPKAREANPRLEIGIYQQIKNGQITNVGQLSRYSGSLSDSQFTQLGRAVVDNQYRRAVDSINLAAGITDNMINPAQEKIAQKDGYMREFNRILTTQVKNEQGVMVYPEPSVAAQQAVASYNGNKEVAEKKATRDGATDAFKKYLEAKRIPAPNLPLDQIDVSKINGLSKEDRDRLMKQINTYKSNL
jgi:hypothetical protein